MTRIEGYFFLPLFEICGVSLYEYVAYPVCVPVSVFLFSSWLSKQSVIILVLSLFYYLKYLCLNSFVLVYPKNSS